MRGAPCQKRNLGGPPPEGWAEVICGTFDFRHGAEWFERAANLGLAEAQSALGALYADGSFDI
jgi:TPR repeat protein